MTEADKPCAAVKATIDEWRREGAGPEFMAEMIAHWGKDGLLPHHEVRAAERYAGLA